MTLGKIAAVICAALLCGALVTPASAKLIYNVDTNEWERVEVESPTLRGGSKAAKKIEREVVKYETKLRPGTVVVETAERRLYLVLPEGKALKYGIGVGRDGFRWSGQHRISRKAEWPGWTPPPQMRKRVPDLPAYMEGGPANPLGARALYIGSTLYRLHGTSEPWTIGTAVSSGCIRLTNDDIIDLYARAKVGATVIVRQ